MLLLIYVSDAHRCLKTQISSENAEFLDTVSLHFIIQYTKLLKQAFSVFQNCPIPTAIQHHVLALLYKAY